MVKYRKIIRKLIISTFPKPLNYPYKNAEYTVISANTLKGLKINLLVN